MLRLFIAILLLVVCCAASALSIELGSMRGFLYGSEPACVYDNWLSHISENIAAPGLNKYALWDRQTSGFGSFRSIPDSLITPWNESLSLFSQQDFPQAQALFQSSVMPFNVILFSDSDSGREYYLIRENLNDDYDDNGSPETWDDETGSFDYGWGLYVFNPSSTNPIIVTAPHPCDDYPSTMMALEAFEKLDARYLMINGAGREVAYYGTNYQSNNSSLSDPTRNPDHPFNVAYQKFADEIRTTFGRTEFSLQVHSYDWATQQNQASVQLSAGNGRYFPCLPIRDLSRRKHDLIHQAPYLVHPEHSIGSNEDVLINNYYSVYYANSVPVYYTRDGYNIQLPNNENYPGSMQNQQMLYTLPSSPNQTFSPFLHVEMDELPQAYEQSEELLKWFYGWDELSGSWNPAERYTRFKQFYMRWINDLAVVVPDMIILDDQELPSDPENLSISGTSDQLTLNWDRCYAYDFGTYLLEYAYDNDGVTVVHTLDQSNFSELGRQNRQSFTFQYNYLPSGNLYTFRLRARDLQGNLSAWTNSAAASSFSSLITSVTVNEFADRIRIQWSGSSSQTGSIQGANIYRSTDGTQFTQYDSWVSNPALAIPGLSSGLYYDRHVLQGSPYYYKVSVVLLSGYEHLDYRIVKGSPYRSYPLAVTNLGTGMQAGFSFGAKLFATDMLDQGVDQEYTGNPMQASLLLLSLPEGQDNYFSKDIRSIFDPLLAQKSYQLSLWTQAANSMYSFAFGDTLAEIAGNLILRDDETGAWYDLRAGGFNLFIPNSGPHAFSLVWGCMEPYLTIDGSSDIFVSQSDNLSFNFHVQPEFLVQNIDLSIVGEDFELSLYTGLPPYLTSFDYTLQDDLCGRSGRLKQVAHCFDGTTVENHSWYQIHFVASDYIVSGEPGRRMLSFATTNIYSTVMDIFGGGNFWKWGESGSWEPTEELVFGRPYLSVFNTDYSASLPNMPSQDRLATPLYQGWNFVANPHQMDHQLKDITLVHIEDMTFFSSPWQWLVYQGQLDPYIWVMRDGALQTDTVLRQGESCLIRKYSSDGLSLDLYPTSGNGPWMDPTDKWSVLLRVKDTRGIASAVKLGSTELGSDGYDPGLDIMISEKPVLPGDDLQLSIVPGDAMPSTTLYCDYKGLYPDYDTVSKSWILALDQADIRPLSFMIEADRLPDSYRVNLTLGAESFALTPGEALSWMPSHAGLQYAVLTIISNVPVSNQDLVQARLGLKSYPNPFRNQLTLELPASKDPNLRLAIYNLKGQLVKDLHKGSNPALKTLVWDGSDNHGNKCAAGIYFIRVSDSKGKLVQRILKL